MTLFTRASRLRTALAVSAFGVACYSAPLALHYLSPVPAIDTAGPLKPEAVRRGAFNNSGSRDIGPEYVRLSPSTPPASSKPV